MAVWQKPGSFRGQGDVAAWLWGIAIRRLVSRLRGRRDVLLGACSDSGEQVLAAEDEVLLSVAYGDVGQALIAAVAAGAFGGAGGDPGWVDHEGSGAVARDAAGECEDPAGAGEGAAAGCAGGGNTMSSWHVEDRRFGTLARARHRVGDERVDRAASGELRRLRRPSRCSGSGGLGPGRGAGAGLGTGARCRRAAPTVVAGTRVDARRGCRRMRRSSWRRRGRSGARC